jgi:hypothetical protein
MKSHKVTDRQVPGHRASHEPGFIASDADLSEMFHQGDLYLT